MARVSAANVASLKHVLVRKYDGLAEITMNRPQQRNALSEEHMRELLAAVRSLSKVRAIILAGNGPVFSAGHDFSDMVERDAASMRRLLKVCTDLMLSLQRAPQPVIARVHGLATAAGCQLVASCDLAVVAEEAAFATPGGRGGWFCTTPMIALSRVIGRKRALEMLFTGDSIDSATALQWGLVNRVVPSSALVEETDKLARAASRGSLRSKAIGKAAFYKTIDLDVDAAYAKAIPIMASSAKTADGKEAMRAFLKKRHAVYTSKL